ncbi:hypothetical protein TSOC_010574 [Tetrabaena socialis]|uniref:Uncharacterized protein n=1 Tax=Tetrabaena socialis TaxID=47790 RepID=A0A2J7ZSX2_9CHLO|nr:hypothetical protein TSOC_010574 [Tetrabaena socialis]|eukprot:PNH03358.1 hypothetical protein TSOC_010574 [Tetrabaena socialis]
MVGQGKEKGAGGEARRARGKVVTCMALLTELKQRAAAVRVLRVSGTLARCKEAAVAHSAFKLQQAKLGKQVGAEEGRGR